MIAYKEVKSILNKHKKRDSWFLDDYSINPYEGCGFNCTYCYVHGSKYGENLAEKIVIKKDAATILDKQLANRAKKNEFGFIAVGSATDAYMQVEEEIGLTKELLQVILKHNFPVFISTCYIIFPGCLSYNANGCKRWKRQLQNHTGSNQFSSRPG